MRPDVSVIIAAFDAAATIERAVRSALASTGVSVEVIVADDASTDGTTGIVEGIGDARVRLLRAVANTGPAGARNRALALAEGRYISVLDADDTIEPGRLRRLVDLMDVSAAAIALDGVEVVDAAGRVSVMGGLDGMTAGDGIDLAHYAEANILFRSAFTLGYLKPTFRSAFLRDKSVAYDETLRIGEDFLIVADILAKSGACVVDPRIGYRYHVLAGSISRVLRLSHVRAMREADQRLLAGFTFDTAAFAAFAARREAFDDAEAFLVMVEATKNRDIGIFARTAARRPGALTLFRMPIAKRLRRLLPASLRPGIERS